MANLKYWDSTYQIWQSIAGPPGLGAPVGGAQRSVLRKNTANDWDVSWGPQSGVMVQEKMASNYQAGWGSTNSTTWVVMGAINTTNITKLYAATVLRCQFGIGGYSTTGGQFQIGANPGSGYVVIGNYYYNQANDHRHWGGLRDLTGVAAGAVAVTWAIQSPTASTIASNFDDCFWWRVAEVFP